MSDTFAMIHWDRREVRLKGSSMSNRGGSTTVRLEIVVDSPWALASLMEQVAEAKRVPSKPSAQPKSRGRAAASTRALPAAMPLLALPAPGGFHE